MVWSEAMRSVPDGVLRALRDRVEACLAPGRAGDVRVGADALRSGLTGVRVRLDHLAARAHVGPPHAGMTMHAVIAAWPAAREILAHRGLPACDACAVGAEETLAEASALEGFDLSGVLSDIRSLS